MKLFFVRLIIFAGSLPFLAHGQSRFVDTTGGYKLVWADEFNQPGIPDSTSWGFETGFKRNHELQWYQPQNAVCKNGLLVIEARREHIPNPKFVSGSKDWRENKAFIDYTSSSLNTRGHQAWQYGRFVMRAKIDVEPGMWPAFWTLGEKNPWPSNGEIDIMEYYENKLLANIAKGTSKPYTAKWFSKTLPLDSLGKNWSKHFHIWRMDWDEHTISLFVDDKLLNRMPMDSLVNEDGTGTHPFKQPHYILLNLALGGDNGGDPSKTTFPRRFEVDYVRVYQKRQQ
jgi:beta-glucanase (GH16 family)